VQKRFRQWTGHRHPSVLLQFAWGDECRAVRSVRGSGWVASLRHWRRLGWGFA